VKNVNLIPAARRRGKARRRHLRKLAAALVTYTVLVSAGYVACYAFGDDDHATMAKEIVVASGQLREFGKEMQKLRVTIVHTEQRLAAAQAVAKHPDWSLLLAMLAECLEDEVVLEQCRLRPVVAEPSEAAAASTGREERFRLELGGFARSQMAVSQFVLRLESIGLFEKVELVKTHRRSFLDGKAIGFELRCSLGAQRTAKQ
jgi:Tfp pilus assembly protein PilN